MAVKKSTIPDPIIVLNDSYQVELDKRCYILKRKSTSEDKELSKEEQKEGYTVLGYYTTWESLGNSLIKEITKEKAKKKNETISIQEFITIVNETNKEVMEMFSGIDKQLKVKKESK